MDNSYLTYTFYLKDKTEIEIEREAYFGFIFAEGFGLKDSLKITTDKIYYKRYKDRVDFLNIKDFISFLMEDMELLESEEDYLENEYFNLLMNKINKISDIKEIKAYFRHYDYSEPELDFEQEELIKFNKFKGDF